MLLASLALFALLGLVYSAPSQRCAFCGCAGDVCDTTPELTQLVKRSVDNTYDEILIDGGAEDDACLIAKRLKEYWLPRYTGKSGWVVLTGTNNLFTSRMEFNSKHNITEHDYLRFNYLSKHDFEIFRPASNVNPPEDRAIGVLGRGVERSLPPSLIYTDMLNPRNINFEILVDDALELSNGVYEKAAQLMFDGVSDKCSAEWVFIIGSNGVLPNPNKFCAQYDYHRFTYFNATWRKPGSSVLSHQVLIFSPK